MEPEAPHPALPPASRVVRDQVELRLAGTSEGRTQRVLWSWGHRNARVGDLLALLGELELDWAHDLIASCESPTPPSPLCPSLLTFISILIPQRDPCSACSSPACWWPSIPIHSLTYALQCRSLLTCSPRLYPPGSLVGRTLVVGGGGGGRKSCGGSLGERGEFGGVLEGGELWGALD